MQMKDSTFLVTEDTGGTRDLSVGVATASLLVGSQDVAHDLSELKRHKVTHILNVAYRYGVCNPFPDVSSALRTCMLELEIQCPSPTVAIVLSN